MNATPLDLLWARIQTTQAVQAHYLRPGEHTLNPAYCNVEASLPLCLNEHRIWALRGDRVLATGIKNVCRVEGIGPSLWDKTDSMVHRYLHGCKDYGHPSLALAESGYDGSVYSAGWLCQREEHIQVLLQSGRYHHVPQSSDEQKNVETYVAYQLIEAYQQHLVLFYDYNGTNNRLTLFLTNPFDRERPHRAYTRADIIDHLEKLSLNGSLA